MKSLPVEPYDISKLKKKNTFISIPCEKELQDLSFNFIFNYNIFPSNILNFCTEWQNSNNNMQCGDTIVQQIYFPPFKSFSQKIIVGVRIKEIFKSNNLVGFSYETIEGHIEKGISTFKISKLNDNIIFSISTYSKANNFILDLMSPFFSSPYQNYCTKKALKNMVQEFQKENSYVIPASIS